MRSTNLITNRALKTFNLTITGLTLEEAKKIFNKFYLNGALLLGEKPAVGPFD